jgi:hypothetical protein
MGEMIESCLAGLVISGLAAIVLAVVLKIVTWSNRQREYDRQDAALDAETRHPAGRNHTRS